MKRIRQHLTYANVMSTLAVFLVLGGATAFAVSEALPPKSVGPEQLKDGAVTPAKLKKGTVTSTKLRKGAVTGAKIKESTLGPVPSAANAVTAATSEGPIAFAHVSANGVLLDARGVTVLRTGDASSYYCFSGLAFAPRGIVATPDYRNETPNFNTMLQAGLEARGGLEGTGCPAGTQAYVHGSRASVNGLTSSSPVGFYVLFFR